MVTYDEAICENQGLRSQFFGLIEFSGQRLGGLGHSKVTLMHLNGKIKAKQRTMDMHLSTIAT